MPSSSTGHVIMCVTHKPKTGLVRAAHQAHVMHSLIQKASSGEFMESTESEILDVSTSHDPLHLCKVTHLSFTGVSSEL